MFIYTYLFRRIAPDLVGGVKASQDLIPQDRPWYTREVNLVQFKWQIH